MRVLWMHTRTDSIEREAATHGQPGVLPVSQTREQTRTFYDRISRVYDLLAERSEAPIRRKGLELLAALPGETVLEVGFGTGRGLASLARAVGPEGRVYGIDLSEGMLRRAKSCLEREGLSGRAVLQCGDAACTPYADATMDAVFMSFTLELFDTPEIRNVLLECRRILKPEGRIVVVGMSKGDGEGPLLRIFQWTHRHFPGLMDCRPIYVRRAIEAAGFVVEQATVTRMWIPVEIVLGKNRGGKASA